MMLFFLSCATAYADIYKYTDENGVICYTDAPLGKKPEKVLKEKKTDIRIQSQAQIKSHPVNKAVGTPSPADYSAYVHKAASKYEIEPELIRAVIKTESNGNHRAVSKKGAMGLMQLMPTTAADMNVSNPFNPEENIEGGTRYLRFLLEKFNGDTTLALAAYNAGPKTVEKYGNIPPISETIQYVKRVFSFYKGKQAYQFNDVKEPAKRDYQLPTVVYRMVLDDGTVLFTNSPLAKTGKVRF
jgi:Transglycosylase SLT domain/Domain of unknown function (DUF4124)